jgi:DNA-binding FadR family transcriptional regulator
MKIEAVKVRRLYLDVAQQIETQIHKGKIKPGERLPSERNLAVSFKVSRPTIREAMIALEIAGLVEIRTGSGIYVVAPKVPEREGLVDEGPGPFEILEARLLIEAETASLAAARITKKQLTALEKALLAMETEDAEGKISEKADQQFHCLIAEASQNSALDAVVEWLWQLRNKSKISTLFHQRVREEGIHPSVEEHRRIFNALKRRDPTLVREAMRVHITNAIDTNMALLEREKAE